MLSKKNIFYFQLRETLPRISSLKRSIFNFLLLYIQQKNLISLLLIIQKKKIYWSYQISITRDKRRYLEPSIYKSFYSLAIQFIFSTLQDPTPASLIDFGVSSIVLCLRPHLQAPGDRMGFPGRKSNYLGTLSPPAFTR